MKSPCLMHQPKIYKYSDVNINPLMLTFTNPSDVVMSSVQLHHPVLRPRALANVHRQWYTWLFPALLGCETPQHLPCSLLVCPLGKQNNQTCIETWTIYAHTCYIFVWTKQHIAFVWGKKRWLAKKNWGLQRNSWVWRGLWPLSAGVGNQSTSSPH